SNQEGKEEVKVEVEVEVKEEKKEDNQQWAARDGRTDSEKEGGGEEEVDSTHATLSASDMSACGPQQQQQQQQQYEHERGRTIVDNEMIIDAVVGHPVVIPCLSKVTSESQDSWPLGATLILWYKLDESQVTHTPLYTIDARHKPMRHIAASGDDESSLAARVVATTSVNNQSASASANLTISIDPVLDGDEGTYKCRVDYRRLPTRTRIWRLRLISPPSKVTIFDHLGRTPRSSSASASSASASALFPLGSRPSDTPIVGPYDEDMSTQLTCESDLGSANAPVHVMWWQRQLGTNQVVDQQQQQFFPVKTSSSMFNETATIDSWQWTPISGASTTTTATTTMTTSGLQVSSSNARVPVRAVLQLNLTRAHLGAQFMCTTNNNAISAPVSMRVTVDINLRPEYVRIALLMPPTTVVSRTSALQQQQQHQQNSELQASQTTDVQQFRLQHNHNQWSTSHNVIVRAGASHTLECRVFGSRPAPAITWFKGAIELGGNSLTNWHHQSVARNNNQARILPNNHSAPIGAVNTKTMAVQQQQQQQQQQQWEPEISVSRLMLVPSISDDQQQLTCSALNKQMANSVPVNAPQLSLQLGANINMASLKLGTDVYFECFVSANPWITELVWLFNANETLHHNPSAGIIVSNQSLALRSLTLERRGYYSCRARNSEGVSYIEPRCATPARNEVELVAEQATHVVCHVQAEPADQLHYEWYFVPNYTTTVADAAAASNSTTFGSLYYNTQEVSNQRQQAISTFETNGTTSVVTYVPHYASITGAEYHTNHHRTQSSNTQSAAAPSNIISAGAFLCFASNALGRQVSPCVTLAVPARRPQPLGACHLADRSAHSLMVRCEPRASSTQSLSTSFGMPSNTELTDAIGGVATRDTVTRDFSRHYFANNNNGSDPMINESTHNMIDKLLDNNNGNKYHLEAYASQTRQLLANVSVDNEPTFELNNLPEDTRVIVRVYASNSHGQSTPATYEHSTLALDSTDRAQATPDNSLPSSSSILPSSSSSWTGSFVTNGQAAIELQAKYKHLTRQLSLTPLMAILIGGSILFIAFVMVLVVLVRRHSRLLAHSTHQQQQQTMTPNETTNAKHTHQSSHPLRGHNITDTNNDSSSSSASASSSSCNNGLNNKNRCSQLSSLDNPSAHNSNSTHNNKSYTQRSASNNSMCDSNTHINRVIYEPCNEQQQQQCQQWDANVYNSLLRTSRSLTDYSENRRLQQQQHALHLIHQHVPPTNHETSLNEMSEMKPTALIRHIDPSSSSSLCHRVLTSTGSSDAASGTSDLNTIDSRTHVHPITTTNNSNNHHTVYSEAALSHDYGNTMIQVPDDIMAHIRPMSSLSVSTNTSTTNHEAPLIMDELNVCQLNADSNPITTTATLLPHSITIDSMMMSVPNRRSEAPAVACIDHSLDLSNGSLPMSASMSRLQQFADLSSATNDPYTIYHTCRPILINNNGTRMVSFSPTTTTQEVHKRASWTLTPASDNDKRHCSSNNNNNKQSNHNRHAHHHGANYTLKTVHHNRNCSNRINSNDYQNPNIDNSSCQLSHTTNVCNDKNIIVNNDLRNNELNVTEWQQAKHDQLNNAH
ncbi:hypothetical protein GZH46_01644, partial [Fragariocoptes setiger]